MSLIAQLEKETRVLRARDVARLFQVTPQHVYKMAADQGFGDDLPYAESSFDRVFSSFMFHHLPSDEKGRTLRAVRRVLKPGGGFYMLDFEGPESGSNGVLAHILHSSKRLKENSESTVLRVMRESGFADPQKVHRQAMLFGHIAYFRAAA